MSDDESGMAAVLAEHTQRLGVRDLRVHCWCGWASERGMPAHRAHVAAALAGAGYGHVGQARAEALREVAYWLTNVANTSVLNREWLAEQLNQRADCEAGEQHG